MSEEKRFTNKKLIAVSIVLVLMCGTTGVLGFTLVGVLNDNTTLSGNYDELYIDYLELSIDFNTLDNQYFILTGEHIELENDYNALVITLTDMTAERDALVIERDGLLQDIIDLEAEIAQLKLNGTELQEIISGLEDEIDGLQSELDALQLQYDNLLGDYQILYDANIALQNTYDALLLAYDYICNTIKQSILPVQYSIFAEAVRRYYMPIYLTDNLTAKEWYMGYAEFCRDMVLHDSEQYNAFSVVSNAFSDALTYGSNTMYLADYIMKYTFDYCDTINFWELDELSGLDELTIIHNVVQDCINNIDYEYDSNITIGQEDPTWDYPKFPVETAFRTLGDCEDQAILCAAYLESCGIETAINIFHDPAHPTLGAFYHGTLMVHIEDTEAFYSMFPDGSLWAFAEIDPYYPPDFTWCFLDPTWDVPFGSIPLWLQDYMDLGEITEDVVSDAICDINGGID